jgi:hypothetical protein
MNLDKNERKAKEGKQLRPEVKRTGCNKNERGERLRDRKD